MGQIFSFCSPSNASGNKKGKDNALILPSSDLTVGTSSQHNLLTGDLLSANRESLHGDRTSDAATSTDEMSLRKQREVQEAERATQRALREKQRLDSIVSTAGQSMLAVHRRNGYYDAREAAIVASNLSPVVKQCTTPGGLKHKCIEFAGTLPRPSESIGKDEDVMTTLARELPWDQQQQNHITGEQHDFASEWTWLLGQYGSTASGENVIMYLDDLSESFLANMLPPSKEQFGSGLDPAVENLP